VIIKLLKSFKNGNVGDGYGWLTFVWCLIQCWLPCGNSIFSAVLWWQGLRSLRRCVAYGLLLYIDFIIQSDVSAAQRQSLAVCLPKWDLRMEAGTIND